MKIKEVSQKFELSEDTLRFYEKKGLIGPIKRTTSGIRDYTEKDLARIEFIKCMRSAGLKVDTLREYIILFEEGDSTINERKKLLEEQRAILKEKIETMQSAYDKLNKKIDLYYGGKLDEYLEKTK